MGISQSETAGAQSQETQSGLDVNVAAALAYVLGFLSGIAMFLVESENDRVRFHAAQSVVVFGALFVASLVLSIFQAILTFGGTVGSVIASIVSLLSLVLSVGALVIWIYLIVRTYQGGDPRIPVAADVADGFV